MSSRLNWEKLLDALAQLREGLAITQELYTADPQVRALLESKIPLLRVSGAFGIVQKSLGELTETVNRLHVASLK